MFLTLYGPEIVCDERLLAVVITKQPKSRRGGTIEMLERSKTSLWQVEMLIQLVHNQHIIPVCFLKGRLDAFTVTLD